MKNTKSNNQNILTGSRIIARASLSILKDTKPKYSRADKHDLAVLREYGF